MATIKTRRKKKTANERLVDYFMERAVDLLRVEAGVRGNIMRMLDQLQQDVAAEIVKIDPGGPRSQRYQLDRLQRLQKVVVGTIKATYRKADAYLGNEVRDLIDIESKWTARAINSAMQMEWSDAGITRKQLETLASNVMIQGAPTRLWWERQAGGLAERFQDEMRRGILLGEASHDGLVNRVIGTPTQPGIMNISRRSAERLVRASVQTAANVGREAVYADNDDVIASLQWHATLDTHTSHWCIVRDSLQYEVAEPHKPINHDVPWLEGPGKLHWNCRSTSLPVLKSWRDLGVDEDEIPETTRSSMEGEKPADMTFEQWLRTQPKHRQDEVIGSKKGELWRQGRLKLRDLLDQHGRPVSMKIFREKYPGF